MAGELYIQRESDETWREAVARQAGKYGLSHECLTIYDALRKNQPDMDESEAAWCACLEWDVLELSHDPQ